MEEQSFVILRRDGKTPFLAMCRRWKVKFFVPREQAATPIEAREYLWFSTHECKMQDFPVRRWA